MVTFIWFFIALSLLVLFHEFGHYIFAKAFGVYVYEFSIFMGPLLYQKQVGETKYSIRLLPIGGYCSMAGELDTQAEEQEEVENLPKERTLSGINRFKQFLIAFAGPFFNIILAFVLMIIFFLGTGIPTKDSRLDIQEGSLFYEAGIRTGDTITAVESILVDGTTKDEIIKISKRDVNSYEEFANVMNEAIITDKIKVNDIQTMKIYVEGKTEPIEVVRTFEEVKFADDGKTLQQVKPLLGVRPDNDSVGFGDAIVLSAKQNFLWGTAIFRAVGGLFTKEGFAQTSGIVGMFQMADKVGQEGIFAILFFVAFISINLGIMNLLPFPALDGGRILILLGEAITRKKLPSKVESFINNLGFLLLLGLIIAVTIKDIFFPIQIDTILRLLI